MGRTTVLFAAVLVAGSTLIASPAPSVGPTDTVTTALFDADSGKGLVAVGQGSTGAELAFHLFGLKPRTKYRLVVSSRGCSSSRGTITSKGFRTDRKGVVWDPVPVPGTDTPRSARIVRARDGKVIACNTQLNTPTPPPDVLKLTNASPGLLVVVRSRLNWRISMSIGGLKARERYQLGVLEGGCSTSSPALASTLFTSNGKGAALVDFAPAPQANRTIGAVGLIRRSNGQVVFCKEL